MGRNRGTDLKITTHTPSAGPIWVSGRLESSIDSEPDCLASDRPRFRFRDDGVADITVVVIFAAFTPKGVFYGG